MSPKWRALSLLALAELLAMSLWFSASAVAPALARHWSLTTAEAAWLTMAVQLGFVTGALLSALLNLPDLWPPRAIIAVGAGAGAAFNAAIPALDVPFAAAVPLRFATGMALAAVYPVGMKLIATWTREDRGLGIGLLVGALTVGSASPHLVKAGGGITDWEPVLYVVSGLAAIGGLLAWRFGQVGPNAAPSPRFEWRYLRNALSLRALRLANFGYFGHMWELYAMWTWVPLFLAEAYQRGATTAETAGTAQQLAAVAAFAVIAAGGVGSVIAGRLADQWGRTRTTMLSMVISGTCALMIGWLVPRHAILVTVVALVWGFAIVADSAQFSSSISELSDPQYMGTQLTAQTSMGFLLTLVSIQLVPVVREWGDWRWAFGMLAIGPALGTWAMWLLRRSPEAAKLAGGRG